MNKKYFLQYPYEIACFRFLFSAGLPTNIRVNKTPIGYNMTMNTHMDKRAAKPAPYYQKFTETLRHNIKKVIRGKDELVEFLVIALIARWPCSDRRRPRRRKNNVGVRPGKVSGHGLFADSVYTGSHAFGLRALNCTIPRNRNSFFTRVLL